MMIYNHNYQNVIVAKSQKGSLSMSCGTTTYSQTEDALSQKKL